MAKVKTFHYKSFHFRVHTQVWCWKYKGNNSTVNDKINIIKKKNCRDLAEIHFKMWLFFGSLCWKVSQPLPYRSLAYNHVLFCDFVTVRFCYLCVIPVHCALFGVSRWTLMLLGQLISLDHPLLYLLLPGRPLVTLLSPSASIAIPPLWIWTSLWSAPPLLSPQLPQSSQLWTL